MAGTLRVELAEQFVGAVDEVRPHAATVRQCGAVKPAAIPLGKVPPEVLGRLLASLPPAAAATDVRLGPALGEDACALDVGDDVLVVAADPITLTGTDVGRFAVIVNANDVAVCGARPRWFLATMLFPSGVTARDVEDAFAGMRDALAETGATLVGGHTEVTDAVRTTVVAGTMLGFAPRGRVVTTSGASAGDVVVQLGLAPVEGAAVLATECTDRLRGLDPRVIDRAREGVVTPGINVVDAALRAAELGASAMHDPTEGGLASGLHELAAASAVALSVRQPAVQWFAPGVEVCRKLDADPWATLASGCVLATFPAEAATDAVTELVRSGYDAAAIGEARPGDGVRDEHDEPIPWPARDEVARLLSS